MSELARDFFSQSAFLLGPLVTMFAFAVVFIAAIVRSVRADPGRMTRMSRLVLTDETITAEEDTSSGVEMDNHE